MYKQTTLIHSDKKQVYFHSTGYPYMYDSYFGLCIGQLQAFQYKNHPKEDKIRNEGALEYDRNM